MSWRGTARPFAVSRDRGLVHGLFDFGGNVLADDSTFTFGGIDWVLNYNDASPGTNFTSDLTGSSFITMTAVPEPSAALLGGLGMFALLRRRRH